MDSATIVFRTVFGNASDMLDPRARNSNLLPVKANGEVLLRSPPWRGRGGSTFAPSSIVSFGVWPSPEPDAIASKAFVSSSPRKIEMIAGGASLAPRRWSWLMFATEARSSPWWRLTAWITAAQKNMKLTLSVGRVAGLQQVVAVVGAHRPVVVLARAVDAGEGLLVQEADEPVLARHLLHDLHRQLLVVGADVRVLEDRRDLVLAGSDLVVPGLDRHAELRQLVLEVHDAGEHALRDRAEVVVVQLVALGRVRAEEGAAGQDQVGTRVVVLLVHEEVLLLGTDRGEDPLRLLVAEQAQRPDRDLRERVHRAQQRDLRVECLARPGDERRRDAEQGAVRVLDDEGGAGRVPGGVAAGLEGVADAPRRERGGVRLALDQLLAREAGQPAAVAVRLEERVVLLRREARERLEDVRVVGRAALQRPVLHRLGDGVGEGGVEGLAVLERRLKPLVDVLRQPLLLHGGREDVAPERVVGLVGEVDRAQRAAVGAPRGRSYVLRAGLEHLAVSLLKLRDDAPDPGRRRTAVGSHG